MSKYNIEEVSKLIEMIEMFISGQDRSMAFVGRIETCLMQTLGDDYDQDPINDFVIAVASYRPGGGQYLYDEEDLVVACQNVIPILQSLKTVQ